jgi:hypothetical protein
MVCETGEILRQRDDSIQGKVEPTDRTCSNCCDASIISGRFVQQETCRRSNAENHNFVIFGTATVLLGPGSLLTAPAVQAAGEAQQTVCTTRQYTKDAVTQGGCIAINRTKELHGLSPHCRHRTRKHRAAAGFHAQRFPIRPSCATRFGTPQSQPAFGCAAIWPESDPDPDELTRLWSCSVVMMSASHPTFQATLFLWL